MQLALLHFADFAPTLLGFGSMANEAEIVMIKIDCPCQRLFLHSSRNLVPHLGGWLARPLSLKSQSIVGPTPVVSIPGII